MVVSEYVSFFSFHRSVLLRQLFLYRDGQLHAASIYSCTTAPLLRIHMCKSMCVHLCKSVHGCPASMLSCQAAHLRLRNTCERMCTRSSMFICVSLPYVDMFSLSLTLTFCSFSFLLSIFLHVSISLCTLQVFLHLSACLSSSQDFTTDSKYINTRPDT